VDCLAPAFNLPASLASKLALFQIGELPEMMHRVQIANLHKPCSYAFHNFAPRLETSTPVGLPFQQVSRMQSVGSELEQAAELPRWCGRPERELLHQRRRLLADQSLQLGVELGEFGEMLNVVEGAMVASVALVLPDVDYETHWLEVYASQKVSRTYRTYRSLPLRFSSFQPG
jgi:hypothetical protein